MELVEFFTTIKVPVTVLHVVSVVMSMGAALLSDTLFTFYSEDKKLAPLEVKTLRILSNMVWIGLIVVLLSGLGLFLSDTPRYLASTKFLAKITILGILLINGFFLHKYIWKHVISKGFFTSSREKPVRMIAFSCGAISMISWVTVCALGVIDYVPLSYGTLMAGYGVVVFGGIVTALIIEKVKIEPRK